MLSGVYFDFGIRSMAIVITTVALGVKPLTDAKN